MALSAGDRLGPYEIVEPLGAGGMGEVYRATDPKLGRDVAIKVLPAEVAQDPSRLDRFRREARLLASLNHTNIAAIHGLEEWDGQPFLVLELVEGEDLAQRLERGPIPLDEALGIARQVAEALEEAHEKGIVHRDLKPANVKLTPDDKVKVLDFGLAKAWAGEPNGDSASDLSQSPTLARSGTQAGVILGTAAYMSPEQAKGKAVDARSDVFSFGALLYEMLTGERLHAGDSVAETLAAVIKEPPSFDRLPAATPPAVRHLLRRCLDKDRRQRLQHIGEARIALEQQDELPAEPTSPSRGRKRERLLALVATLAVILAAAGWGAWAFSRPAPLPAFPTRFEVRPPDGWTFAPGGFARDGGLTPIAVSPDGRRVAFVAVDGGGQKRLWVRPLDSLSSLPLEGTEGAWSPFWSPDSRSLAFFAGGKLKKVELSEGAVTAVSDIPTARLGSGLWRREGSLFLRFYTSTEGWSTLVVPASGGQPRPSTEGLPRSGLPARSATFLPDGRHSLAVEIDPEDSTRRGVLRSLAATEPESVIIEPLDTGPVLYSQGHVLFLRFGTLLAQGFDTRHLKVTGEPLPVAPNVSIGNLTPGRGIVSVSDNGVLIYRTAQAPADTRIAWLDRRGQEIEVLDEGRSHIDVALAPDGRRAAVSVTDGQADTRELWLYDTSRTGVRTRLWTGSDRRAWSPAWSPDGRRVAFIAARQPGYSRTIEATIETATEDVLMEGPDSDTPTSWSMDGGFVLLQKGSSFRTTIRVGGGSDLWVLPLSGDRQARPILQSPAQERNGQFSPDGRFIAFQSNESGRFEVYALPFPGPGPMVPISAGGGWAPRWGRDGREIFYLDLDNTLMAASVTAEGDRLEVGAVRALFEVRPPRERNRWRTPYDVSPDGQRFLVINIDQEPAPAPITVVLNWAAGLKE